MHKGKIVTIYKEEGETPLKALERFRAENPEYRTSSLIPTGHKCSLTYIGRLDPMAEGLLLILIDGTTEQREGCLNLDKRYRVEVLFGAKSDTGDILGLLDGQVEARVVDEGELREQLQLQVGTFTKPYPPYSSKPVNGNPLFIWAREGRLSEVKIPTHIVKIHSIELIAFKKMSGEVLLEEIKTRVSKVAGDFRQEEIKKGWTQKLSNLQESKFILAEIIVSCGSGAYMRMLAEDIGKGLGVSSLAYRIKRESVGDFRLGSGESQRG